MHAFDRRTDGQTEFSLLDRVCIPCSAVKTYMGIGSIAVWHKNDR